MWSKNGMPVATSVAPEPSTTSVDRDRRLLRLAAAAAPHGRVELIRAPPECGEERVVLGRGADRDAEAPLDARPATRSRARARRASSSRFHSSCASPSHAERGGSSRPTDTRRRPRMSASAANRRPRSSTSDATRASISARKSSATVARDLRRHRERVRQQRPSRAPRPPTPARRRSRAGSPASDHTFE